MNKKIISFVLLVSTVTIATIAIVAVSHPNDNINANQDEILPEEGDQEMETETLTIVINGVVYQLELYGNPTAKAFLEKLPMTLTMQKLNNNEKYTYIDVLPTNPERVGKITTGDIMLYGNNCIVLFYDDFDTSYIYTKIGHILNNVGLNTNVGNGPVTVSFVKSL